MRNKPDPKEPTPAEFVAALAKRGVTLHTDGARIWALPKSSMTSDEHAYADGHNAELVAALAPKKDTPDAVESKS